MNNSIFVLIKHSESFEGFNQSYIASSFNESILEEMMVKLENKTPDIPEVVWKKFRRYALKKDPNLDDYSYGIANYTHKHSECKYTLDQLKEAEDYYENEFSRDIYIIEEIPFIND